MNTETTPHRSLEEVEDLFKNWRKTRTSPKPMPRRLWEAATGLTAEYPIPTATGRISFGNLFRRLNWKTYEGMKGPGDLSATNPLLISLSRKQADISEKRNPGPKDLERRNN